MNQEVNHRVIDYRQFVLCPDISIGVARRDNTSAAASFSFRDDMWQLLDLLRPHEHDYDAGMSFTNIPLWLRDDAKRYVAHLWLKTQIDAKVLQQILGSIRDLGKLLPDFKGTPIDLRAREARTFSRRYARRDLKPVSFQRVRRNLNRFMTFVRRQHPEVTENDFNVQFPKDKTDTQRHLPLEQAREVKVDGEVFAQIINACVCDTLAYFDSLARYIDPAVNKKEYRRQYDSERYRKKKGGLPIHRGKSPKHRQLLSRAIKAQAIILAACVGRRPAAVCSTKLDVKTEAVRWTEESGGTAQGVTVRFREHKVLNVDEDVFCPETYGELALGAIRTAKELTADLRRYNPQWKDYLFLVPGIQRNSARVLSTPQLNAYLTGGSTPSSGLIERYAIPVKKFSPENFRHTRATNLWEGGLQIHEVSYDLGHVSAEMAVRHYIAGNEESRRRLQFLMDRGALSGLLDDFVGGREMVEARLGRQHVQIMKRSGRIVSPTRYGYCCLPAASGPCIRTTPCYMGPEANAGGCDYHVLSPDALPALEEDKEVILVNIKTYRSEPEYGEWVRNQHNQLSVVEQKIAQATELRRRAEGCGCEESCDHPRDMDGTP